MNGLHDFVPRVEGRMEQLGSVQVWRLPLYMSQSRLGGRTDSSNACTIIVLKVAEALHQQGLLFEPIRNRAVAGASQSPALQCPNTQPTTGKDRNLGGLLSAKFKEWDFVDCATKTGPCAGLQLTNALANAILDGNTIHELAVGRRQSQGQKFTIPDAIEACDFIFRELDYTTVRGPIASNLAPYVNRAIRFWHQVEQCSAQLFMLVILLVHRTMRNLDHPNVLKVLGIAAEEEPAMIVMEFMQHGSLLSYLRGHTIYIQLRDRLRFSTEAVAGLKYLEKNKCMHRDVAARNCLLGPNKEIKIADFGLSRFDAIFQEGKGRKLPIRWLAPETLRTVKPGNFAMGRVEIGEARKVYVLDFGMCRKFINDRGEQRTPRAAAGFRGTVRYAPINCHLSRELSRKDDLETWLYQQVEITKGFLPWRNVEDKDEVGRYKERVRQLPARKDLLGSCPREFVDIMRYIDNLRYFDVPNYLKIQCLMRSAYHDAGGNEDHRYEWEAPPAMLPKAPPASRKPK